MLIKVNENCWQFKIHYYYITFVLINVSVNTVYFLESYCNKWSFCSKQRSKPRMYAWFHIDTLQERGRRASKYKHSESKKIGIQIKKLGKVHIWLSTSSWNTFFCSCSFISLFKICLGTQNEKEQVRFFYTIIQIRKPMHFFLIRLRITGQHDHHGLPFTFFRLKKINHSAAWRIDCYNFLTIWNRTAQW